MIGANDMTKTVPKLKAGTCPKCFGSLVNDGKHSWLYIDDNKWAVYRYCRKCDDPVKVDGGIRT